MEAHLSRSCRSPFYLCEIWGAQRGVTKRECWGGRLGCALLCLFVCVGLRGFCMIIFYSDGCRRNVLQLLDKTWGKDKRRVTRRSVGVRWNVLTHWVKNVLTFCALDRVKMLRALKWGRFGFEWKENYLKRNCFVYTDFSGCEMNKCVAGWYVACWRKRKTHFNGENTLGSGVLFLIFKYC
jgi:hypothetical protein